MLKLIAKFALSILIVAILYLLISGNLLSSSPFVIAAQLVAVALSVWARRSFQAGQSSIFAEPKEGPLLSNGPYQFTSRRIQSNQAACVDEMIPQQSLGGHYQPSATTPLTVVRKEEEMNKSVRSIRHLFCNFLQLKTGFLQLALSLSSALNPLLAQWVQTSEPERLVTSTFAVSPTVGESNTHLLTGINGSKALERSLSEVIISESFAGFDFYETSFEQEERWNLFEEIVNGNPCYGENIGEITRSSDVAKTGQYSFRIWSNKAGSNKGNHIITYKDLIWGEGVTGRWIYSVSAYIPIGPDTSNTGPEVSVQNTRRVEGKNLTFIPAVQYVRTPTTLADISGTSGTKAIGCGSCNCLFPRAFGIHWNWILTLQKIATSA